MKKDISVGTTNYAWITYDSLLKDKEQNLQVIHWPNGEGFTVVRDDNTTIDIDWDEWAALKRAVIAADKLKDNPLI